MIPRPLLLAICCLLALRAGPILAQEADPKEPPKPNVSIAKVGEPAPAFTLRDLDGKEVSLSDFKEKVVVLEWFNPDCPVVVSHYERGSIREVQQRLAKKGVVWLAINSGGTGKQGTGVERNKKAVEDWKLAHPILLDEPGKVGRTYRAATTPHCFVIDQKGVLRYAGAIDNGSARRFGDTNYVEQAALELLDGKAVTTSTSRPYG